MLGTGLWHWRCKQVPWRASILGCAGDVPGTAVGCVMHGLSDHQRQYMLLDRRSFKQFAGLVSEDQVLDPKTLWKYRDFC